MSLSFSTAYIRAVFPFLSFSFGEIPARKRYFITEFSRSDSRAAIKRFCFPPRLYFIKELSFIIAFRISFAVPLSIISKARSALFEPNTKKEKNNKKIRKNFLFIFSIQNNNADFFGLQDCPPLEFRPSSVSCHMPVCKHVVHVRIVPADRAVSVQNGDSVSVSSKFHRH